LTGPDIAFCTRVLALVVRAAYPGYTRYMSNTTHVLLLPFFAFHVSFVSVLRRTLSRTTVNNLSLCGFRNSYNFIHRSIAIRHSQILFIPRNQWSIDTEFSCLIR